jgi:filamentous hemagglutinin family protein
MATRFWAWLFNGSILLWLTTAPPVWAEIKPDNTLPNPSTVTSQGNTRIIEGGTQRGRNLFHSFEEFSFSTQTSDRTGDTVLFSPATTVGNIITRVTGGTASTIDGTVQVAGEANLFFINPNGITFGANAHLDLRGSFIATTANRLQFADGTVFSANPANPALLTMSVPTGLQFGANSGAIANQSQASPAGAVNQIGLPVGLQVQPDRTLALLGNTVSIQNGNMTTAGGRIEIGSINTGRVGLNAIASGYSFDYTTVQQFRDIQFSGFSIVNTSGESGGAIQLRGRNITVTEDSQIFSVSSGANPGQPINIRAERLLQIENGAFISTFTAGSGSAGDLRIRANSVQLSGGQYLTGIGSQVLETATGNGGNLIITANQLQLENGAIIDASTFGAGRAGDIRINADEITLIGTNGNGQIASGIFAQVAKGAIADAGNAGQLNISTAQLTLLDGAQISTAARSGGQGGSINIQATNFIRLSGASPIATETIGRSGIFVSAEPGALQRAGSLEITTPQLVIDNQAEISANNFGPDRGGTITLNLEELTVRQGDIRATSFNSESGRAGDLIITASRVLLDQGRLTAETRAVGGANIRLQDVELLALRDRSRISARAENQATGGNLSIQAPNGFVIAAIDQNNDIIASAVAGRGGNITIQAQGILGLEERRDIPGNLTNDIDASSEFGAPGTVNLTRPEIDPSEGLTTLPVTLIDASQLVAQGCGTGSAIATASSAFVITGRGGLPPAPSSSRRSETLLTDWGQLSSESTSIAAASPNLTNHPEDAIAEAQGWIIDANGTITLMAQAPNQRSFVSTVTTCNER